MEATMRCVNKVWTLFVAIAGFLLCVTSSAEVPRIMTFQGKLTDSDGHYLHGSQDLRFKLYDRETGGAALWEEQHEDTPVTRGVFAVPLGVTTPLSLPFNTNYWVSVEVDNDGEMSPRQQLTSAPYAFRATGSDYATRAGQATNALALGTKAIDESGIADGKSITYSAQSGKLEYRHGEPASLFRPFGGDGRRGPMIISSDTNVSDIDDPSRPGIIQSSEFTLNVGATLTVDTGWLYLGCSGTCIVQGVIDATGQGGRADTPHSERGDWLAASSEGNYEESRSALELGLGGAGGGGGFALGSPGGCGGGAGGYGGLGGLVGSNPSDGADGVPTAPGKLMRLTGGTGDGGTNTIFTFNPAFLASGGGGGGYCPRAAGGSGGGVIYVEANSISFTGQLNARGIAGGGSSDGRGGGGGGGVAIVRARHVVANTGVADVSGGLGGPGTGSDGGDGADGFKAVVQVE
jgi:hypothetical protein